MMLLWMDHQQPVPWLNFIAGTGDTGYWLWWWSDDRIITRVLFSVVSIAPSPTPENPRVVLKTVACPGLSLVLMPTSRAPTSKSGVGLHGVPAFT